MSYAVISQIVTSENLSISVEYNVVDTLRNNESIESVLEAISDIVPIEYEIDDNGIYINESFRK